MLDFDKILIKSCAYSRSFTKRGKQLDFPHMVNYNNIVNNKLLSKQGIKKTAYKNTLFF